jgi:mannose-6-phosphate isomerase
VGSDLAVAPLQLAANPVPVYYRGGASIARFRGLETFHSPEDWVGSLTTFPSDLLPPGLTGTFGISPTDFGPLSMVVAASPLEWLGHGDPPIESGLLVKLLDAGERLPVHWHPDKGFAQVFLASCHGKAEAWVVLSDAPSRIWLGARDGVSASAFLDWIEAQDVTSMMASMNEVRIQPGDVVYVPPGVVHAIDVGAFLLELQEPTSFSVLAEYQRLGVSGHNAALGVGWPRALSCLDLNPATNDPETLVHRGRALEDGIHALMPREAESYFRCTSIRRSDGVEYEIDAFTVLVAAAGTTRLQLSNGDENIIEAGETWVLPASSGHTALRTTGQIYVCQPPLIPNRTARS